MLYHTMRHIMEHATAYQPKKNNNKNNSTKQYQCIQNDRYYNIRLVDV